MSQFPKMGRDVKDRRRARGVAQKNRHFMMGIKGRSPCGIVDRARQGGRFLPTPQPPGPGESNLNPKSVVRLGVLLAGNPNALNRRSARRIVKMVGGAMSRPMPEFTVVAATIIVIAYAILSDATLQCPRLSCPRSRTMPAHRSCSHRYSHRHSRALTNDNFYRSLPCAQKVQRTAFC
jgi:hypothetical protein